MRKRLVLATAVAVAISLLPGQWAAASTTPRAEAAVRTAPASVRGAPLPVAAPLAAGTPTAAPAAATPATGAAAALAAAAPIPTRTRVYDGGYMAGETRTKNSQEAFSSAAVGNVTGHKDGDTDVVAGFIDGTIHVWSQRTGRQEFVVQTGGPIAASPTLVRTSAKGPLVVLTGNKKGDVWVFGFTGGKRTNLFHKHLASGVFGTPTMADLDRNGKMWIIATSWDEHLYVWDMAGHNKPGFPYWAQDTIWSSPTVATLDGDPYPQIIFGYDCSGVSGESCFAKWHTHGGVLVAIKHTGKLSPGFPVFFPGQVIWSTPAVASLFGTAAKQIVVGTGLFWNDAGKDVYIVDARGHKLKVIGMSGRTFSSPAIGDVLGIRKPQIVIGTEDGYTDILDSAWHRRAHVCTAQLNTCVHSHSSPIIGDLYGDGHQEIVAVGGNSFYVIDRTGKKTTTVQIKETALGLAASPTLANINGKATLFFALMAKSAGGTRAQVISYTFPKAAGPSAWPTFKATMNRAGTLPTKVVPVPAT